MWRRWLVPLGVLIAAALLLQLCATDRADDPATRDREGAPSN
ncbi:MAG TPA: hypothetical protein VHO25_16360 [Polyangiaceae bacterium]|nr:hypothetical protein [Polyangiaceae bacterium]